MPELPEVETVKRGLNEQVKGETLENISFRRGNLRNKIPQKKLLKLCGHKIENVNRRAKYLLFNTSAGALLNHLGMTGTWRLEKTPTERKHDHLSLVFTNGFQLIYNDPRRFGIVDYISQGQSSPWLNHLGPEPLVAEVFTPGYLWALCRRRQTSIKNLIMDQRVVVGVGNIYASESLFLAGVRPGTSCRRVSLEKCQRLVEAIRGVLGKAIEQGGTTIKDFRQAGGSEGYFQQSLHVYGRAGEACSQCGSPIRLGRHGQRSSFWCSHCQK